MPQKTIGIMGAMPEEVHCITEMLTDRKEIAIGRRIYHTGLLNSIPTVVVFSRWGKVAAAMTVTTLILEFNISELIFTGVAGAISPELNIGDIVIGKRFVQHDMDARPLMPQFEIPLLGVNFFKTDNERIAKAQSIITEMLERKHLEQTVEKESLDRFSITNPKAIIGDIASGDQFFADQEAKQDLLKKLPSTTCVEMEGAAVAQACYEYEIPFTIIRTISDTADEKAVIDFPLFIKTISSKYSMEIVKLYFEVK